MVLADDCAAAAVQRGAPVLGRRDPLQPVELPDALQPLINELPGAGPVRPHFAAVFPRPAAGAV